MRKASLTLASLSFTRSSLSSLVTCCVLIGAWLSDPNLLICCRYNFVLGVVTPKVCLASKQHARIFWFCSSGDENTKKLWHNQKGKSCLCVFVCEQTWNEFLWRRHPQVVWAVSPAQITPGVSAKRSDDFCNLQPTAVHPSNQRRHPRRSRRHVALGLLWERNHLILWTAA